MSEALTAPEKEAIFRYWMDNVASDECYVHEAQAGRLYDGQGNILDKVMIFENANTFEFYAYASEEDLYDAWAAAWAKEKYPEYSGAEICELLGINPSTGPEACI